ncbi:hypothetical protein M427DRAFT_62873 [Gonapodya prolifera JEL478]|uniref:HCP-like protein n=1 Tax=Gonapodya prolifera (strain JEL478) TaxID=1344416 RepID=A0A139A085_GONPJ|nr:hypothetical protein M427DRAFT_62873 [Gonapodya prolifera JEL478]|eukprot:KXS10134.1 hypothetical protein M427DRAFT_62873 [Gonapodya prolifera JEL478]
MGVSTQQGWGVPCCLPLSCFFFSISSRLGDADAQEQLGYAYKNGAGVRRDKWKAALWLRESAMAGAEAVGDGKPVNVALARSRVLGDSWIWKQKWGGPDL